MKIKSFMIKILLDINNNEEIKINKKTKKEAICQILVSLNILKEKYNELLDYIIYTKGEKFEEYKKILNKSNKKEILNLTDSIYKNIYKRNKDYKGLPKIKRI